MRYLVVYDIADDSLRDRVAEAIDDYGVRVQWSVFECVLSDQDLTTLQDRLIRLLGASKRAAIRFYPLCDRCASRATQVGDGGSAQPYVIV